MDSDYDLKGDKTSQNNHPLNNTASTDHHCCLLLEKNNIYLTKTLWFPQTVESSILIAIENFLVTQETVRTTQQSV